MDPAILAATATALVAPYLAKLGESFMEETGAHIKTNTNNSTLAP